MSDRPREVIFIRETLMFKYAAVVLTARVSTELLYVSEVMLYRNMTALKVY